MTSHGVKILEVNNIIAVAGRMYLFIDLNTANETLYWNTVDFSASIHIFQNIWKKLKMEI